MNTGTPVQKRKSWFRVGRGSKDDATARKRLLARKATPGGKNKSTDPLPGAAQPAEATRNPLGAVPVNSPSHAGPMKASVVHGKRSVPVVGGAGNRRRVKHLPKSGTPHPAPRRSLKATALSPVLRAPKQKLQFEVASDSAEGLSAGAASTATAATLPAPPVLASDNAAVDAKCKLLEAKYPVWTKWQKDSLGVKSKTQRENALLLKENRCVPLPPH
jgi:hypothetical protein